MTSASARKVNQQIKTYETDAARH